MSKNTSAAPHNPCWNGCFVSAFACTIGAVPNPASLDNIPLAMPICIAIIIEAPAKPPTAGAGEKA